MLWHRVEFEDADVGHVVDVGEPGHVGRHRPAADVEEDLVGPRARRSSTLDGVRAFEPGVAADEGAARPCRRAMTRRPRGRRARSCPCAPSPWPCRRVTSPVPMPYSAPRRATWAACALATSVLVGMQPELTQVPPTSLRSITATVWPASVSLPASGGPAWPAPTMIASNFSAIERGSDQADAGRRSGNRHRTATTSSMNAPGRSLPLLAA